MSVLRVLARRLPQAIPVILGLIVLNFALLQALPGDAVDALAYSNLGADAEQLAELRRKYGLDQPWPVQLGHYVWNLLSLDFGYSVRYGAPAAELIFSRLGPTLLLMLSSLAAASILGVAIGVICARRAGGLLDRILSVVSLIFYSTPSFWLGLMLIVLFSVKLQWLPVSGFSTAGEDTHTIASALDVLRHLVLPMMTLALIFAAIYARLTRSAMLEIMGQDFVRTARAKGLRERTVLLRHVLRNALLPIVTMMGLQVGNVMGGAVVVETIFAWPGIGSLMYEAVQFRDSSVVLGILLLSSVLVIAANIVVDLLYARLDPRIE